VKSVLCLLTCYYRNARITAGSHDSERLRGLHFAVDFLENVLVRQVDNDIRELQSDLLTSSPAAVSK